MSWYRKIVKDWDHIPDCLDYFENELADARVEVKIKGNVEKAATAPLMLSYDFRATTRIRGNSRTSKYTVT